MSNTTKYIAIAVAIWLVWSYLSNSSTVVADDCQSKGGCGESDPTDLSNNDSSAQIPTNQIPGGHLKYAQTQVVR